MKKERDFMLTIKTDLLKTLLNKADKCASKNKMLPLTCMLCIEVKNNTLTLTTTDGSNYLFVKHELEAEDFYVVVDEEMFVKLVAKTTSDTMTFELVGNHLNIAGNGAYSLELPDENGALIVFPNPIANRGFTQTRTTISKETLSLILKTNKIAVSQSFAEPCYTGYYMHDAVVTSDRTVVCCNDVKIFDTPMLINPELMNILSVFDDDVMIMTDGDEIVFCSCNNDEIAYGHLMHEIDDFNIEAIMGLVKKDIPYKCEISRNMLQNVLDRLSLFVTTFDKNAITLKFTHDYLEISSINTTAIERIKYAYVNETADTEFNIDIELLRKQISVLSGDVIELWYGSNVCIKLVDGDTIQLIPLLTE